MAAKFLLRSRHGTVFYFRRRVPRELQQFIGSHQIVRSLHTSDRRAAIVYARRMAVQTDDLFQELRAMSKKKNETYSSADYTLSIDMNELTGQPKNIHIQADPQIPGDAEAAQTALQSVLQAHGASEAVSKRVALSKTAKPLVEAVAEFLRAVGKAKTFRAYRTALERHAIPFFGAETSVSEITQERFAQFVDDVFSDGTRAHNTKEGYVNALTSMMSWLRARYPSSTPILTTKKLLPAKQDAGEVTRNAFAIEHLPILFGNAARFREAEPWKFWVTVASAFLGCRVEELAQVDLRVDLKRADDIWYFDFNERADGDGVKRKSLKKPASWRVAPIHSALVRHGFIAYLEDQKREGASRPFERGWRPWEEPAKGGWHWAHYIIRWGSRELEKLNAAKRLPREGQKLSYFHSMRHLLASTLAQKGVPEEQRAALQGQAVPGSGENSKRYAQLRGNVQFLAGLVEEHLGEYARVLDEVCQGARTAGADG